MSNAEQHLRGDESNQLDEIDGYSVVNLRARYQISEDLEIFANVLNLFDEEYESFGLLGEEPGEVEVPIIEDFEIPVFLGAGPPRAALIIPCACGMWQNSVPVRAKRKRCLRPALYQRCLRRGIRRWQALALTVSRLRRRRQWIHNNNKRGTLQRTRTMVRCRVTCTCMTVTGIFPWFT